MRSAGAKAKAADLLRESFGWGFWGFAAFALLAGLACYLLLGPQAFAAAVDDDLAMIIRTLPRIVLALAVAGLVWVMLPRDRLMRLIGRESGLRGLLIATAARVVTPGGPASAYPFLAVLAGSGAEVSLEVAGPVTQRAVLDALEARYPMLRGTIRDHVTQKRRAYLHFFACKTDLSNEPPDAPVPEAVAAGAEPFIVLGAIAGG